MGILDELKSNSDWTREELERQRQERDSKSIETIKLEQVPLPADKSGQNIARPLERLDPDLAQRAAALSAQNDGSTNAPSPAEPEGSKEPTKPILTPAPGGQEPPSIGPGSMFGTRIVKPSRQSVSEKSGTSIVSGTVSEAGIQAMKSSEPRPVEKLAAELDGQDLFAAAEARARAAREIEKLRPRENGDREFTIRSRSR